MSYKLRDDLAICETSDTVVFFDLRNDRYFCLNGEPNTVFLSLIRKQRISTARFAKLDPLIALGYLEVLPGQDHPICPVGIEPAKLSAYDEAPASDKSPTFKAMAWQLWAAWHLKTKSLSVVINGLNTRKLRSGSLSMADIVMGFRESRRFFNAGNKCLRNSIALHQCLRHFGHDTKLVIGVRLSPFAAHAWVQHQNRILNDELDTIAGFTPIFVA